MLFRATNWRFITLYTVHFSFKKKAFLYHKENTALRYRYYC